jgi:cytochrome c biogenesis protein CcmG/thiol:disulfide interchange protein DsbE
VPDVPVATTDSSVTIASPFPNFPLVLYQGYDLVNAQEPRFYDLLGKQPVVLNFWASNCPPCSAEMPEFQKVYTRYKDRVLFVGLDVGRFFPGFGDQEVSKQELKRLSITYMAGTPLSVEAVRQLQVKGLPSTLFLTPEGKVYKQWIGILNEEKLLELVEDLLNSSRS